MIADLPDEGLFHRERQDLADRGHEEIVLLQQGLGIAENACPYRFGVDHILRGELAGLFDVPHHGVLEQGAVGLE
ncbi:hypothetical protein D3C76_1684800 [compost metagenome]